MRIVNRLVIRRGDCSRTHARPTPHGVDASAVNGHRRGAAAFTLIELMMVLVLMAILATVMIPLMIGTHHHELLRSAGRDLMRALDLTYSQAVTRQLPHRLHLDVAASRYQIERPAQDTDGQVAFSPVKDLAGAVGNIDKRITLEVHEIELPLEEGEEPQAELIKDQERALWRDGVEFYPNGTSQAKEIVLKDREGYSLSLRINPATAQAALAELGRR